jgi:hypothetical protein
MAGLRTATAVDLAVDAEVVQMLTTPLEGDLQNVVEVSQRGVAMHEEAAPDERADASQNAAQLIDGKQCGSGRRFHALSVAQCVASLKDSPRILALSLPSLRHPDVNSLATWPYTSEVRLISTVYGPCHGITGTDEILLKGEPSTTFVL